MLFWRRGHAIRDEDLSAYIDGELADAARVRVESHLETCAACHETLSELRAVRVALESLPRERAPRSFALREADVTTAPVARAGPLGRFAPALGGVAMVAFLSFWALVGLDLTDGSPEPTAGRFSGANGPLGITDDYQADSLAPAAGDAAEDGDAAPPVVSEGDDEFTSEFADDGDEATRAELDGRDDEPAPAAPQGEVRVDSERDDEDFDLWLRVAQAVAAAVALAAGGWLAAAWWRQRA